MPTTIYRAQAKGETDPLLVVVIENSQIERPYVLIGVDTLDYVVMGFLDEYDLGKYERLPLSAVLYLDEPIPLYVAPSLEKEMVVDNFIRSVQWNDTFLNDFAMNDKTFELVVKNFSFNDNEGYVLLNVYGKEYQVFYFANVIL
jgi:hypothetical protein